MNPNLQVLPAARWMAETLIASGKLRQSYAASHIKENFHAELIYSNDNFNPAIESAVLDNFHGVLRTAGYKAIWINGGKWWTLRELGYSLPK